MEKLNNLKTILYQRNMTSRELADRLGVNISTVTKWCTNKNQPESRTVRRICEILDINSKDFYTF